MPQTIQNTAPRRFLNLDVCGESIIFDVNIIDAIESSSRFLTIIFKAELKELKIPHEDVTILDDLYV